MTADEPRVYGLYDAVPAAGKEPRLCGWLPIDCIATVIESSRAMSMVLVPNGTLGWISNSAIKVIAAHVDPLYDEQS